MKQIEIVHKTSADFRLFRLFAEFIIYHPKGSDYRDFYDELNKILGLQTGAGRLANRFSEAEKQNIFIMSTDSYNRFCTAFLNEFNSMTTDDQDDYRSLYNSFYQWKHSLDLKHSITHETDNQALSSGQIEKKISKPEFTLDYPGKDKIESQIGIEREEAKQEYKMSLHNESEMQRDVTPFSHHELELLLAITNLIKNRPAKTFFSRIEFYYIDFIIKACSGREGAYAFGKRDKTIGDSLEEFHHLFRYSWETLEIDKGEVIHKAIIFTKPRVIFYGFSFNAYYRQHTDKYLHSQCFCNLEDQSLTIIGDYLSPEVTIELLSFPMTGTEYTLGHKIIFNRKTHQLSVSMILLKNTFKVIEHQELFYEVVSQPAQQLSALERAYLENPTEMKVIDPLKNLHLSIYMLFKFYHEKFPL